MYRRLAFRVGLAAVVLFSVTFLIGTNISSATESPFSEFQNQSELPVENREPLAPQTEGITVVTSHLVGGQMFAVNPDGTLRYYNDTRDGYWDVDPAENGTNTVVYAATDEVHDEDLCTPVDDEEYCIRQTIERANLTTGETEVLYSRVDPRYHASEWHDIDQVNSTHYLVADMYADEVFMVNTSSGVVEWEWSLQNHFSLNTGGPYPVDWAHLNDVELLDDGRIMLSPRNMDQVIFLDPDTGTVDDDWTIGADGQHETLFAQHNPDYIPESNGGPAVLVSDSENNRIVEYQRDSGEWNRTWEWQDSRLQWPRDADRLPNGHTLITDTHGGRIIEVDTDGEVVWTLDVPAAYEAERLNTGEESANGPSAAAAELPSQTVDEARERDDSSSASVFENTVNSLFPTYIRNVVANVTPVWVSFVDSVVLLIGLFALVVWIGLELMWSDLTIRSPITRRQR